MKEKNTYRNYKMFLNCILSTWALLTPGSYIRVEWVQWAEFATSIYLTLLQSKFFLPWSDCFVYLFKTKTKEKEWEATPTLLVLSWCVAADVAVRSGAHTCVDTPIFSSFFQCGSRKCRLWCVYEWIYYLKVYSLKKRRKGKRIRQN